MIHRTTFLNSGSKNIFLGLVEGQTCSVLCTSFYFHIFILLVLNIFVDVPVLKLIILSRSRGRSDPVVRHWEQAQYRHMCHRLLGHVLQKGDRERQRIVKYSIYNREEQILDPLLLLFSLCRPLKHYQRLYTYQI